MTPDIAHIPGEHLRQELYPNNTNSCRNIGMFNHGKMNIGKIPDFNNFMCWKTCSITKGRKSLISNCTVYCTVYSTLYIENIHVEQATRRREDARWRITILQHFGDKEWMVLQSFHLIFFSTFCDWMYCYLYDHSISILQ